MKRVSARTPSPPHLRLTRAQAAHVRQHDRPVRVRPAARQAGVPGRRPVGGAEVLRVHGLGPHLDAAADAPVRGQLRLHRPRRHQGQVGRAHRRPDERPHHRHQAHPRVLRNVGGDVGVVGHDQGDVEQFRPRDRGIHEHARRGGVDEGGPLGQHGPRQAEGQPRRQEQGGRLVKGQGRAPHGHDRRAVVGGRRVDAGRDDRHAIAQGAQAGDEGGEPDLHTGDVGEGGGLWGGWVGGGRGGGWAGAGVRVERRVVLGGEAVNKAGALRGGERAGRGHHPPTNPLSIFSLSSLTDKDADVVEGRPRVSRGGAVLLQGGGGGDAVGDGGQRGGGGLCVVGW